MGEIRFVGTGETRGYPYLVCKKKRAIPITNNEQKLFRKNHDSD